MDSVLRTVAIYIFILIIFRINGKKSISQITTFDFVLLLIVGEVTDGALTGTDSVVNAFIVIITLMFLERIFSILKEKFRFFDKAVDSVPLIILQNGKVIQERLDNERVDEYDILEAARRVHGLERLNEIKFAVLEKDGTISIIPQKEGAT